MFDTILWTYRNCSGRSAFPYKQREVIDVRLRKGKCLCGQMTYEVRGEPLRVGLCHCTDCRKESGSSFVTFAVWPRDAISSNGGFATHDGRSFCPACGSRLFNLTDNEAEIRIGSLDKVPTDLTPSFEIWIKRREPWLAPLPGCQQFDEDPPVIRSATASIFRAGGDSDKSAS